MDLLDRVKKLQRYQRENALICVNLSVDKRELASIKMALDTVYAYEESLSEELGLLDRDRRGKCE